MYAQVCTRPDIAYNWGDTQVTRDWIIGKQLNGLCGIYREQKILCSHTENRISWRSLAILIPIFPDAKIVEDPLRAKSTCLLEELFLGIVLSKHS